MYVPPPGVMLGSLAVHGINKLFAHSENNVKPKIFVLQYPSFLKVSTLAGKCIAAFPVSFFSVDLNLIDCH